MSPGEYDGNPAKLRGRRLMAGFLCGAVCRAEKNVKEVLTLVAWMQAKSCASIARVNTHWRTFTLSIASVSIRADGHGAPPLRGGFIQVFLYSSYPA